MTQTWKDVLFAHWPVDARTIQKMLPRPLEVDTFDGQAWVSLVLFELYRFRLRFLPPLPFSFRFPQINVRTYVKFGDASGVYFLSVDTTHPLAVAAARLLFHTPFFRSAMSIERVGNEIRMDSIRSGTLEPPAVLRARYRPLPESQPKRVQEGTLEHWLIERYRLYTTCPFTGKVYTGTIHHPSWLIQEAEAELPENTLLAAAGLPLTEHPALLLYSQGVQAWIDPVRAIEAPSTEPIQKTH